MGQLDTQFKALEMFERWSNVLLVTTTAALGWASTEVSFINETSRLVCLLALALSIAFGILTLAVIPLIAERLHESAKTESLFHDEPEKPEASALTGFRSFYNVKVRFRLFWLWPPRVAVRVKLVCWPQHLLFIAGIVVYALFVKAPCD